MKAIRLPGSVAPVSVVTVRLVRRRLPAAVRRAASKQIGKTQYYRLQQLNCTMKLLAISPSLDVHFVTVLLLVSICISATQYAVKAF